MQDAGLTHCRADLAALLGNRDQALDLLRAAIRQGLGFNQIGLHVDLDLASLRNDPTYESLMQPKD